LSTSVSRHFATLGETQVHYRRAGVGPAVVLLHQSPSSSSELVPLMQRLAGRFTAIAPDLPGYGASDPLAGLPLSIESLADHVVAFMDELGFARAAVYGFHTGASVALSLARRHPLRLSVAICEGLLCLSETERSALASRYIEPFVPRFDGGQLAWLWTRIKDQSLFFPWYDRSAAARLDLDATPVPALARRALDWLRSGERYGAGYAAAFAYDPRADLPFINVPLCALCHRHDPLAAHLPRLEPLPANVEVRRFGSIQEGFDRVEDALLRHAGNRPAPAVVAARPLRGRVWQDYVRSRGIALRVVRTGGGGNTDGAGRTSVLLHAAQSSAGACREWIGALGARRRALAIELPGHGETDCPVGCELENPTFHAELVKGALDVLAATDCDLIGWGAGAAVQVEVARHWPSLARSLILLAALDVTRDPALQAALRASYAAPEADSHGGYLLRAWHEARDHLLFFPWYERRRAFALADSPCLEPKFLQARTVDALLADTAGVALRRAEIGYPLLARLSELRIEARHAAPPWDPRHAHSRGLAVSSHKFLTLSRAPERWREEIETLTHSAPHDHGAP
jgi:pimeloyl-ACP methyl ester carboxylesterase